MSSVYENRKRVVFVRGRSLSREIFVANSRRNRIATYDHGFMAK